MALPNAVTNGRQNFVFANLPQLVALDGSASNDPDAVGIASYAWSILDSPVGSAAALSDPAIVNPTFVADLPGGYIIQLEVTTTDSRVSLTDPLLVTSNNYHADVIVSTEHLALRPPGGHQREWQADGHGNWAILDALGGVVAGITATAPRHHILNPGLIPAGGINRTWTAAEVGALLLSSGSLGARVPSAGHTTDGNLSVQFGAPGNQTISGVFWAGLSGDFDVVTDLRIRAKDPINNPELITSIVTHEAGFGWIDEVALDFSVGQNLYGAGWLINSDSWASPGIGTYTGAVSFNFDGLHNAAVVAQSALWTEMMVRLIRSGTNLGVFISVDGGGWIRVQANKTVSTNAGWFCFFGGNTSTNTWEIRSTGVRDVV